MIFLPLELSPFLRLEALGPVVCKPCGWPIFQTHTHTDNLCTD